MSLDVCPLVSVGEGNSYFANKLKTDNWDEANDIKKSKAIKEATSLINNLAFKGCKFDNNQETLFPRIIDEIFYDDVPDAIKIACLQIAYSLLDDTLDMELEFEGLADVGTSFASIRADKNPNIYHEHIRAGIPNSGAWTLLKPYLINPLEIHIVRG